MMGNYLSVSLFLLPLMKLGLHMVSHKSNTAKLFFRWLNNG